MQDRRLATNGDRADRVAAPDQFQIPESWLWTMVGYVGHVRVGLQRSPERRHGRFPTKYLRAANVTTEGLALDDVAEMDVSPNELRVYALQPDDLIVVEGSGSAAQVGRTAIWTGEIAPCAFQNSLIRFRPHAVVPEYALAVFRYFAEAGLFASVARGVGIQHLGASRFAAMSFPLPPWPEQERIVADLERRLRLTMEAEDSLRSALARIEDQVTAILEAAATGYLLGSEATDSRDRHCSDQRLDQASNDDSRDASQTGDPTQIAAGLPPGWIWTTVGEVGGSKLGKQRSPAHERGPSLRPYLRVANVFEDCIDGTNLHQMNFTPAEQEAYRLFPGDILLNEGQSPELVGRPAMYRGKPSDVYYQNHLIRFRAGDVLNPEFALLVFRHYFRSGRFTEIARWSTNIATLGLKRFLSLPFPLPPLDHQAQIVKDAQRRLSASTVQQSATEVSLEQLKQLRRELLAAAVSGRLVPQAVDDEMAVDLLARLGPPAEGIVFDGGDAEQELDMARDPDQLAGQRTILEVLREAGGSAPVEKVFAAAGYDRDSTEDIEAFYLELHREIDNGVFAVVTHDGSAVWVKTVADASR